MSFEEWLEERIERATYKALEKHGRVQNDKIQGEPRWLSYIKQFGQAINPFAGIIGVIIGALLANHLNFASQIETSDREKRQQVYSQLMGENIP